MKTKLVVFLVLALCASPVVTQAGDHQKGETKKSALDRFKALAGEWTGKGTIEGEERDFQVVYKVTSGGSAIVETIFPGSPHEMVSVIHEDGDALLLTHYCMLGNQPHMKAMPKEGDNKVVFEFVKATNLKSEKDMYMRSATFMFVDKDTLKTEWTHYKDGKESGKGVFELKRKK
jgi:hypothetical protein